MEFIGVLIGLVIVFLSWRSVEWPDYFSGRNGQVRIPSPASSSPASRETGGGAESVREIRKDIPEYFDYYDPMTGEDARVYQGDAMYETILMSIGGRK